MDLTRRPRDVPRDHPHDPIQPPVNRPEHHGKAEQQ